MDATDRGVSAGVAELRLPPLRGAAGTVRLPGSKSISNRVLLLAALAQGDTEIRDLLDADDVERMLEALRALGVVCERGGSAHDYRIHGVGGCFPVQCADLFLGNAGTALRPLAAVLALAGGHYRLSGVPRMHERPVGDLVDALRQLGARVRYLDNEGFPPLEIEPAAVGGDGCVRVRGEVSSQFLTALLIALPLTGHATTLQVSGELISKPYVEMTIALMARFGVCVERSGWTAFGIPAAVRYQSPGAFRVEGDASSASYFLAAGAIGGGPVRVEGVGRDSIQGDVRFADALQAMGASIDSGENWIEAQAPAGWSEARDAGRGWLKPFDGDLNHIPDAAMTLAIAALFADGPSTLRNIGSWRVKETDRLHAMATELRKLGAEVEEGSDYLAIVPPQPLRLTPDASIATYDDHRMAMCFALLTLGGVGIGIEDPQCVAKTFPDYFECYAAIAETIGKA